MKIITVIGARPQFIKAATVSRVLAGRVGIEEILIHTGQHYDQNMSDIFFDELSIPRPKYNLGIGGGSHGEMTGRQLEEIEKVLLIERPDMVLVYGDTNSTLAGALSAVKLHIPVAHVEAGLRSYNKKMPEEINRIATDHVSDILFAPTESAVVNLGREGISKDRVHNVGDVMYDAAIYYKGVAKKPVWFDALGLEFESFILSTVHRAENTDDRYKLANILDGLGKSAKDIILPLHPRTRQKIEQTGIHIANNIRITDPVGYLEMVWLESACEKVITDSGGVQKEAYFHGKHCVTMREETEWVELVESGWNALVGTHPTRIAEELNTIPRIKYNPNYGSGDAAVAIVDILTNRIEILSR